jgi:hypothetical protein
MGTYGPSFEDEKDAARADKQHERIRDLMQDAKWRTLAEIGDATGDPHASISAQLRHLRKPQFGSYNIEKRRRADGGLWEYRLNGKRQGEIEVKTHNIRRPGDAVLVSALKEMVRLHNLAKHAGCPTNEDFKKVGTWLRELANAPKQDLLS